MSSDVRMEPGTIIWHDVTVPNAGEVRDFYAAVVGWRPEPVEMHGHEDYNMMNGDSEKPIAGVCHSLGEIADLPSQWLMYVVVEDIEASISQCNQHDGRVVWGPGNDGMGGKFCVVEDPAGAVIGLIQPA